MNYRRRLATTTCDSLVAFQLQLCYLAEKYAKWRDACAHAGLTRRHSHSHANRQCSYISEGLIGCVCHSGGGVICIHGNAAACLFPLRPPHFITLGAIISIIMWVARGSALKKRDQIGLKLMSAPSPRRRRLPGLEFTSLPAEIERARRRCKYIHTRTKKRCSEQQRRPS